MMKRLLLIFVLLFWSSPIWAAEDSCWCQAGSVDATGLGITVDGSVWCYALTTGGTGGNLDSLIFFAKNVGDAATVYGVIYDTVTGGKIGNIVDRSNDSVVVTAEAMTRHKVSFEEGTIDAATRYFICVWVRAVGSPVMFVDECNDGTPAELRREHFTDAPELEDPASGTTADTTNYAPNVIMYYTTSEGATLTGRRRRIILGQ